MLFKKEGCNPCLWKCVPVPLRGRKRRKKQPPTASSSLCGEWGGFFASSGVLSACAEVYGGPGSAGRGGSADCYADLTQSLEKVNVFGAIKAWIVPKNLHFFQVFGVLQSAHPQASQYLLHRVAGETKNCSPSPCRGMIQKIMSLHQLPPAKTWGE